MKRAFFYLLICCSKIVTEVQISISSNSHENSKLTSSIYFLQPAEFIDMSTYAQFIQTYCSAAYSVFCNEAELQFFITILQVFLCVDFLVLIKFLWKKLQDSVKLEKNVFGGVKGSKFWRSYSGILMSDWWRSQCSCVRTENLPRIKDRTFSLRTLALPRG